MFASSSSVYGIQENLPIKESASTNPISAHGIGKLAVEKFLFGPEQNLKERQGFILLPSY